MKHYTFNNFLADDTNRDAFQIATRIADLEPVFPLPVLLLGDNGCGKTHLLYAIVNRLRASSSKTGLAYITPSDFPEQVRALVDDPSRVQRAQSAVLLVDQLDRIDQLDPTENVAEELEAVIRIFLDNNHYVAIASSTHPSRLRNLTDGLRELINAGTIVEIQPLPADKTAAVFEGRARRELDATITEQRQEIERLQHQLQAASNQRPPDDERADLENRLRVAGEFSESLQRDLDLARHELEQLRATATGGASHEELHEVRNALQAAHRDIEQTRHELEDIRSERDLLKDRIGELERGLEEGTGETAPPANNAAHLVQRAEALMELVEANRLRFAQIEEDQREQIEQLEKKLHEQTGDSASIEELEQAKTQTLAALDQLEEQRQNYEHQLNELREEVDQANQLALAAREERDGAVAERDELKQRLAVLQAENEDLRHRLDSATSDHTESLTRMEASEANLAVVQQRLNELEAAYQNLQTESFDRSATANARIGELQEQLQRNEDAYHALRGVIAGVAGELSDFASEMRTGAQELDRVATRLTHDGLRSSVSTPPGEDHGQPEDAAPSAKASFGEFPEYPNNDSAPLPENTLPENTAPSGNGHDHHGANGNDEHDATEETSMPSLAPEEDDHGI